VKLTLFYNQHSQMFINFFTQNADLHFYKVYHMIIL